MRVRMSQASLTSLQGTGKPLHSSILFLPWVVLTQFFFLPPLALVSFFISPWFKRSTKIFAALALLAFLPLAPWLVDSFYSYQNLLWVRKFSQARKRFEYDEARVYLERIQGDSPLETLELGLMRLDHNLSGGLNGEREALCFKLLEQFELEFSKLAAPLRPAWDSWTLESLLEEMRYSGKISAGPRDAPWNFKSSSLSKQERARASGLFGVLCKGGFPVGGPAPLMLYALKTLPNGPRLKSLILKAVWLEALISAQPYLDSFELDFYLLAYLVQYSDSSLRVELEKSRGKSLEAELGEYVSQSPYHLKAYYFRGLLYLRQDKIKEAVSDWLHVFKLDVYFFDILERLLALMALAEPEGSTEALEIYFKAESVRFLKAEFSKSLELASKVLTLKNDLALGLRDEVLFNQGVMYRNNLKNYKKAVEVFDQLLSEKNTIRREEALYNLVMCQLELGDYQACETRIFQLIENHPNSEHRTKLELLLFYVKTLKILGRLTGGGKA